MARREKDPTGQRGRPATQYSLTWHKKFLNVEAQTLEDVVREVGAVTDKLMEIYMTGKVEIDVGPAHDYLRLVTTDRETAERFGFEKDDFGQDDFDDDGFEGSGE